MTIRIREFATQRDIKYLLHFTRISNLESILERGLVRRDTLTQEGYYNFNDQYRYDGTSAVCLSIGFPNYKMFWGVRKDNPNVDWAILAIRAEALWSLPCAFCSTNAASSCVTIIPLEQRMTMEALQQMYADWGDTARAQLNIPMTIPRTRKQKFLC